MVLSGIGSDGGGLNAGKMSMIDNMDLLLYFIHALLSYHVWLFCYGHIVKKQ